MFAEIFKTKTPLTEDFKSSVISDVLQRIEMAKPVAAILFGSFATDYAHDDSDIDVLIICRDSQHLKEVRQLIYADLHAPITKVPVDFIFVLEVDFEKKKNYGGICMVADKMGKIIYGSVK